MGNGAAGRPRLMTRDESVVLAKRIMAMVGQPKIEVRLGSGVWAWTRFALGDSHFVREAGSASVQIIFPGGTVSTTRLDDEGIMEVAERGKAAVAELGMRDEPYDLHPPVTLGERPKTYYDNVAEAMAPLARAAIMKRALDATEAAGLVGAGDIFMSTGTSLTLNAAGMEVFRKSSIGTFSLTARTPDGTGSGWGWTGFEDWSRVDVDGAIHRAVDLALRSRHPVALEPGRYTVILEPCAVAALVATGINWVALPADMGGTVFSKDPVGTNKIGLQVLDARVNVTADPWDPDLPEDIVDGDGDPVLRTTFVHKGYLRELEYGKDYAKSKGRAPTFSLAPKVRWAIDGPTQTLDEMIASTKRGVWVNRLSGEFPMHSRTGLVSGTTRDGTFLIENGKVTKAIKNFRFNESPMFVLNKLEAFGVPERASEYLVVPRVKVRDFEFTSLTDAV